MKKVKVYKGFVIATDKNGDYHAFTTYEWGHGEGYRYPEYEGGQNMQEVLDFIDSY